MSSATARAVPTGTVDLLTTTAPGHRCGAISATASSDVRQVGGSVVALWRRKTEEHELGVAYGLDVVGPEREPRRREIGAHELGQPVLDDRNMPGTQVLDAVSQAIGAVHRVPEVSQARGRGQADVARTEDDDTSLGRMKLDVRYLTQCPAPPHSCRSCGCNLASPVVLP